MATPAAPRSRRSLLTAAAAAGGAMAAQAFVRPNPVAAADVVLGAVNTAAAVTTIRTTEASGTAKAVSGLVMFAGMGNSTAGVQGQSNAANGNGVFGVALSGATAKGVWGRSSTGFGVYGEAIATTGANYGVRGVTPSTSGIGVHGIATATTGATTGVLGSVAAANGRGVHGSNTGFNGTAVFGVATVGPSSKGVHGRTATGIGVYGEATDPMGSGVGVLADVAGQLARAVVGRALGGAGVEGIATASGGRGVNGIATGGTGAIGVRGSSTSANGWGVYGFASGNQGIGVEGETTPSSGVVYGVRGVSYSPNGFGVYGIGNTGGGPSVGARGIGYSTTGYGVQGIALESTGVNFGVYGETKSVTNGFAGYFLGRTHVQGTLSKTGGSFLIDHPQDPANKTLEHSFVEGPERLNVYRGNVVLDANGQATVRLPRYFRALNRDYSYQLTAVGAQAPGLYVAREIERNSFAIAGGVPGQKVCWQVTGARQDAWAQANPLRVERTKKRQDRGKFLNPDAFGKPRSAGIHPIPKVPRIRRPRRDRSAA
jgi:hypothetical protein